MGIFKSKDDAVLYLQHNKCIGSKIASLIHVGPSLWVRRIRAPMAGFILSNFGYDPQMWVYRQYPELEKIWWPSDEDSPPPKRYRRRKGEAKITKEEGEAAWGFLSTLGEVAKQHVALLDDLPPPSSPDLLTLAFDEAVQKHLIKEHLPQYVREGTESKQDATKTLVELYAIRAKLIWLVQAIRFGDQKYRAGFVEFISEALALLTEVMFIPIYRQHPELMPATFKQVMALNAQRTGRVFK